MKDKFELISVDKIWDKAPHNAFTDLIRYDNSWYCTFREGDDHFTNGKIRVISSKDGKKWKNIKFFRNKKFDYRDPKFSITAKNELMINTAIHFIDSLNKNIYQSATWLCGDDKTWSDAYTCPSGKDCWRWSVSWVEKKAYSIAYIGKDRLGCLYSSKDGKSWRAVKKEFFPDSISLGNESSLVFLKNKDAYCLLRRDAGTCTGILGYSKPPYKNWDWKDLKVRIGGPKIIYLEEKNLFLAVVRLNDEKVRTSLCLLDPKNAKLEELLELPSGGDTSYAGMVYFENLLWISYYSSHEEDKTSIYLAKVKIS
ncbi:hypothetical protein CRV08_04905 [Halarcobacter ebronensis]|uniref:Exo-alpha-sialidase n=1 Tax=Halarcobacter ebronensis TaxID=1462615 RepID=A0A4Q0YGI8_9BACT|nr:sialidase family protein [Halarcobacter ebronensis]RXJ69345.1 hypothetical protein CRV08_04905 [Halarcobacter ebronensis]